VFVHVIPLECNATVQPSQPIFRNGVGLLKCINEVFGMFVFRILDFKVINY
jgi:hypothetical protein